MSSRFGATPRLTCQQLEDRCNPDGNVAVFVTNGGIYIGGDGFSNAVSIQQNAFGDVFVVGQANTTVNGVASLYLGRGNPNFVRADMGFGHDYIEVIGMNLFGDISIQGNFGNDTAVIYGVTNPTIVVEGNDGSDQVYMSQVFCSQVILDGGFTGGIDGIHLDNVFAPVNWFNYEYIF